MNRRAFGSAAPRSITWPFARIGRLDYEMAYPLIAWPLGGFYDPMRQIRKMALASDQRRLAAILAADAVGCSRLMGRDESGTLMVDEFNA